MDENPKKPHDHAQQIPGQFQQRAITTPTGHAPGYKPRWVPSLPPQGQMLDMVWVDDQGTVCVWNGEEWVCFSTTGAGPFWYDHLVCSHWASIVAAGGGNEGQTITTFHGHTFKVWSKLSGPTGAWKAIVDATGTNTTILIADSEQMSAPLEQVFNTAGGDHQITLRGPDAVIGFGTGRGVSIVNHGARVTLIAPNSSEMFTAIGDASSGYVPETFRIEKLELRPASGRAMVAFENHATFNTGGFSGRFELFDCFIDGGGSYIVSNVDGDIGDNGGKPLEVRLYHCGGRLKSFYEYVSGHTNGLPPDIIVKDSEFNLQTFWTRPAGVTEKSFPYSFEVNDCTFYVSSSQNIESNIKSAIKIYDSTILHDEPTHLFTGAVDSIPLLDIINVKYEATQLTSGLINVTGAIDNIFIMNVRGYSSVAQTGTFINLDAGATVSIGNVFAPAWATVYAGPLGTGGAFTDYKVLVSSDDDTPDFLEGKVIAGDGISIVVLNPGADEDLEINSFLGPTQAAEPVVVTAGVLSLTAGKYHYTISAESGSQDDVTSVTGLEANRVYLFRNDGVDRIDFLTGGNIDFVGDFHAQLDDVSDFVIGFSPDGSSISLMGPHAGLLTGPMGSYTIATGAIDVANAENSFTVDTEAAAATDDLDTINNLHEEHIYMIAPANGGRTVVLKHGTGNLLIHGNADVSLDDIQDSVLAFRPAGGSNVHIFAVPGTGGGAGGHTIHDEVAAGLTARTDLHFMGNGVVVLDNAVSTRTEVVIPTVYDAVVDPGDTNAIGKGNVYAKIQDAITAGHKSILVRGVATDAAPITIAGGDAVQVIVGDSTLKAVVPKDLQCQKSDVLLSSLTFATDTTLATATKLLITGERVTVFACLFAGALAAGSAAVNNAAGLDTTTTSVAYDTGVDFLTRTGLGPIKIDDEIFYVTAGGNAASGTLTVVSRGGNNNHYTLNTTHADNAVITDMTAAAITIAAADVTVIQCRFIALTHDTTGGLKKHGQAILVSKNGSRARIVSNVFLANTLFALISGWPEDAAGNTFEPKGVQIVSNTANANSCVGPLIQIWPNTVGDTAGREVTAWNITGNTLAQGEAGFIWVHHRGTVIAGNLFDGVTRFNKTMLINKVGGIAAGDTTIPYDTVAGSGTLGTDWGIVEIDSEIIIYGSSDGSNLYNCMRGVFGTTATTHADNATINLTTQLGLLNTRNNAISASAYVLASGNVFMTIKIPLYSDNGFNLVRLTLADNVFFSSTAGSSTIYGGTLTSFLNNVWGNGNTLDFMSMTNQALFGGSGNLAVRNPNVDTAIFFPVGSLTGVATAWGLPAGKDLGFGRAAGDVGGVAKPLTNRTGASTVLGHVVIADTANDNSFVLTTTAGAERVLGVVVQGSVANLSDAMIGITGIQNVLCNGTVNRGDYLTTSTTSGEATSDGTAKTLQSFALALTARSGAGSSTVKAKLL